MVNDVKRNLIYSILIFIVPIFLGLVLSFFVFMFLPGDPVIALLQAQGISHPSPEIIAAMRAQLGLDQPIFLQFLGYLLDSFTGNLGVSVSISPSQQVFDLLAERIPESLAFTVLPAILGLFAGILLGIWSVKVRYKSVKVFIQILIILGISMPIFFIGMWFQYFLAYQLDLFPSVGDPFLPSCILFLLTLFLTTRQVRSNYLKESEEKHILSNSMRIILNLSVLIVSMIVLEVTFGLHGFFELFIIAFGYNDFWVIRACIFILIALPVIILFISNLGYTIYNFFLEESQSPIFTEYLGRSERMLEEGAQYAVDSDQKFKDFIIYRLKSPLTIIGLAIVVFTVLLAIFPQILTPLTFEEANGIYAGAYDPPSETHLLGQTKFGRDVLALLAYGISTLIMVCILPVLIGIAIGVLFGYLSKVDRILKGLVLGFLVVLFIIPSVLVILIFSSILGRNIVVIMSVMAMYTIPGVTLLISKGDYSLKLTAKKLIASFPLYMAFNILLFEAIGFLGFSDPFLIQLGTNINDARAYLYIAPWASLWSGFAIYVMVIGFVTLHYGLKEPIPIDLRRSSKF